MRAICPFANRLGTALAGVLVAGVLIRPPSAAGADDWPGWRGPTHDGIAAAGQDVPVTWSADENVVWMADVPGRGNSSPTVVGEHVYLTSCDEAAGSQSAYAFQRGSGRLVWSRVVHPAGAMRKHKKSTGASASIACDGERLFLAFASSGAVELTALSLAGEPVWRVRLCDYVIHQGYGASPLVYRDSVIAVADHSGGGVVAAYERRTGRELWRTARPPAPNYSSPIVFHLFGRDQLILTGCDRVVALDPATGELLWERAGATTECVTTPVTDGTRVFSSGGFPRNHVAAIRADGTATVDWENGDRQYVPSLIVHDKHLYGVLDAGVALCRDAATGDEKWKARLGGTFSGSPVLCAGRIYVTSEAGATHVFRAGPEGFAPLAVNTLGDEACASPTICGGRIYLRYAVLDGDARRERLACIGFTPRGGTKGPPP